MDPNNNNNGHLNVEADSDPSSLNSNSQSSLGGPEDPSTQVMDDEDRDLHLLADEKGEDHPEAWAKLEAINEAYSNIILTQDVTSFGRLNVDVDITSQFHKLSRHDADIMSFQVMKFFACDCIKIFLFGRC